MENKNVISKLAELTKSEIVELLSKRDQSQYRILASKLFSGYPTTSLSQALGKLFCELPSDNKVVLRVIQNIAKFQVPKSLEKTILGNARKHFRTNAPSSKACPILKEHNAMFKAEYKKAKAELVAEAKAKAEASKASKAEAKAKAPKAQKKAKAS